MSSRQGVSCERDGAGKAAARRRSPLQPLHNGVARNGTTSDSEGAAPHEVCEEWASNAEAFMSEVQRVEAILAGRGASHDRAATLAGDAAQQQQQREKGLGYWIALIALEVTFVLWLRWTLDVYVDFRAGTASHAAGV